MPLNARARSPYLLPAAFAVVVLSFSAATAFSLYWVRSLDEPARQIAFNIAPGIERLSSARSALRRAQLLLTEALQSTPRSPLDRAPVEAAWRKWEEAMGAHQRQPRLQGEEALLAELEASTIGLRPAMDRVIAALEAGKAEEAREAMPDLASRVDVTVAWLLKMIELHAQESANLAERIDRFSSRATTIAIALNVLSALVAAVAALLVARSVRAHERLTRAYQALLERQVRELEEFAARMAHDIRGPLGAANIAIDLIGRKEHDPSAVDLLSRCKRSLTTAAWIVEDLLDFARSGAQPDLKARTEVAPVLERVLEEVREVAVAARVELGSELEPGLVAACGPGVLSSVVGNLVRNAIRYIGESEVRRLILRARKHAGLVRLEVEDTGPGIPPELHRSLYEPYVRGPAAPGVGLGLGLSTVKRLVEAHHGRTGLQSTPGKGSLFWVELPQG